MRSKRISSCALMMTLILAVCSAQGTKPIPVEAKKQELRPVIVQGAMDIEVQKFVSRLDNVKVEKVAGWTFWRGTLDGYPVIVSKTLKGVANAAAATVIAAERYRPVAIINQGTSGGHYPQLRVYDIVLGKYSVNLGSFKTAHRKPGQGSDPREWTPMDLLASEGSAGTDPQARTMRRFQGDEQLMTAAQSVKNLYRQGRVVEGVIGTSDMWNSELDSVRHFHTKFGTSVEEMETASAAQIAGFFQIPFLGIRVLSNNITNDGKHDRNTGLACQDYVYDVVKAYIKTTLRHVSYSKRMTQRENVFPAPEARQT